MEWEKLRRLKFSDDEITQLDREAEAEAAFIQREEGKNRMMTYLMAGVYKHYKGGYYQLIGVGAHSETDERLVAYISIKPPAGSPPLPGPRIRLRPVTMWDELVKDPFYGNLVPRFKYVGFEIPADDNTAALPEVP